MPQVHSTTRSTQDARQRWFWSKGVRVRSGVQGREAASASRSMRQLLRYPQQPKIFNATAICAPNPVRNASVRTPAIPNA